MGRFKKPVPSDRTIVPGTWSDLLDDLSVAVDIDGNTAAIRINLKNIDSLKDSFFEFFAELKTQNQAILHQLCLLNARFESMANTTIDDDDIGD